MKGEGCIMLFSFFTYILPELSQTKASGDPVPRKRLTTGCLIFYPDLWDNASMKTYSFCSYSFYSFCSNYGLERKYGSGFSGKTTNSYRTMEKKYNWVPGQRYWNDSAGLYNKDKSRTKFVCKEVLYNVNTETFWRWF